MRARGRRFHAAVSRQPGERPVVLTLGPGCVIEASADEARALAIDICDALEALAAREALG